MKNYNVNNIVEYAGELCVIYEPSFNGMWVRWGKGRKVGEVYFLMDWETADVKDVEISDWVLDRVFKKVKIVDGHGIWAVSKSIDHYSITHDVFSQYSFYRGNKKIATISTIRQLQNLTTFGGNMMREQNMTVKNYCLSI